MNCHHCKGSGCVVATEKATGYIYAFACPCGSRKYNTANFPVWGPKHLAKFTADHLKPVTKPVTAPEAKKAENKPDYQVLRSDPSAYSTTEDLDDLPF